MRLTNSTLWKDFAVSPWLAGACGVLVCVFVAGETCAQRPQAPPGSGPPSGAPQGSGAPGSQSYPGRDSYEEEMEEFGEEEYEMDSDYESEYGGYGGTRSPRRGGGASDAMMQSYASTMSSLLRNVDLATLLGPSSAIPPVDAGPLLSADAEHAYQSGNYPLALELYFAHLATEYDHARVSLQTVGYSKLLKRPVWQTQFGVSFTVRGELDADPQPIKEGKTPLNRMNNAGGRGQQEFSQDAADEEFGREMEQMEMEQMEMEREEMEMEEREMMSRGGTSQVSRRASQPQASMLSEEANQDLEKFLGLVAIIVAEEFDARYRQGDFGSTLISVVPLEPVNARKQRSDDDEAAIAPPRPMSQEVMDLLADSPETRPLWKPGILYYGEGESADVIREAKRENVDLVLHFDIFLKAGRQEHVQNVSRCRLLQVSTGKSLGVSKGIDNFEAIRLAQMGRSTEREYVTEQLENLFGVFDRSLKLSAFPTLTPDVAKRRIGSLMSGAAAKRLRTLAEVRLYQAQELITPEEAEAAFYIIGGEDGMLMLHGPADQRLETARKWALRAVPEFEG